MSTTAEATRLGEIDVELTELGELANPTRQQAARSTQLVAEADQLRAKVERRARIKAAYEAGGGVPGASFEHMTTRTDDEVFHAGPGDADDVLRAIDISLEARERYTGKTSALRPNEVELRSLIERNPRQADTLRAAADPHYLSAFGKLISAPDPSVALLRMTDAERNAFAKLAEAESRAVTGLADAKGGYAVPVLLDPSIIYTGDGNANPFRRISRIVTGMDDTWRGVTSAGITASWDSEFVQVSEDSPTLAQPTVVAHKAQAFVPFSVEIEGDWASMAAEMGTLFQESKDDLESAAFSTGTGTDEPVGILTALFAGSAVSGVLPTTDGQFGAVDVYKVFGALPARYRRNASWIASIDVQNAIRQFGDDQMSNHTVPLNAGYEFGLLGRPVYEASGLPDFTGTTGAANIMVVGDFRNYVLFDRLGSRVEIVPHLMGANGRPNGSRGLWFWWRVGADATVDNSFRMLMNE